MTTRLLSLAEPVGFIPSQSLDTMSPPGAMGGQYNSGSSSFAWGTANKAIYCPLRVPVRVPVKKLWCDVGNVGGTGAGHQLRMGIYNRGGTRLVTTAATDHGSSFANIIVDVSSSNIVLPPNLYYLAIQSDSTTDEFRGWVTTNGIPQAHGYRTEAVGSAGLPTTATWTVDTTNTFIPMAGFLMTTLIS